MPARPLGGALSLSRWEERLQNGVARPLQFHARDWLEKSPRLDPRLILLSIGDSTLEFLQDEDLTLEEWARLLRGLASQGPRAILIDKVFGVPRGREYADRFVSILRALPCPVAVGAFSSPHPIAGRTELVLSAEEHRVPGKWILEGMKPVFEKAGIIVESDLPSQPLPVLASPTQLREVVTNLLQNALDAMEQSPRKHLSLRLRGTPQSVAIEVEDTGQGMPEAVQRRLFEPFYTTKSMGRGTGLGLAICHGIIREHKGRIEVESEPGKGSVFRVILPQPQSRREAA